MKKIIILLLFCTFILTSCNKPNTSTTNSNSTIEPSTNPNTETTTKENTTPSTSSETTTTPETSTSSPVGDYDDGEEWKGTIF
ncbi:MAG: hypothetical protein IKP77_04490 [Acholeplasmatales bacterium]|nr:hypothetical protein [Acholeplasmatales bacterium]